MILCVSPNPALDRVLTVPGLQPGRVFRARDSLEIAAGKGVNLARAVRTLGGKILCAGPLGGPTGRRIAALVEQEGMPSAWTWIDGNSRTCTIIVDPGFGESTVINETGPRVASAEWARLEADVLHEAGDADCVCFSGSLPPGVAGDAFERLLNALLGQGRRVWVDASGDGLAAAMGSGVWGIKVNLEEACAALGCDRPEDPTGAVQVALRIRQRGVAAVSLTLGHAGGVLCADAGAWHAQPPSIAAVSAVGSGDSFLAGLITSLESGLSEPESLRRAVAAGAANALRPGAGVFSSQDFESVLARTTVCPVG
jgi:tagatose 6-phosphate kinase